MKKFLTLLVATAATASVSAFAVGPDFTSLTAAVDWTTAIAALLLVMSGLAGVYIIWTGGGLILAKIRAGK